MLKEVLNIEEGIDGDWRTILRKYCQNLSIKMPYRIRQQALNFAMIDDILYQRIYNGILLRRLGQPDALEVSKQVYNGVCRAHQAKKKMGWLIRRHGHY